MKFFFFLICLALSALAKDPDCVPFLRASLVHVEQHQTNSETTFNNPMIASQNSLIKKISYQNYLLDINEILKSLNDLQGKNIRDISNLRERLENFVARYKKRKDPVFQRTNALVARILKGLRECPTDLRKQISDWVGGLSGEIGELKVALYVPSNAPQRSIVFSDLLRWPSDTTDLALKSFLQREVDVIYNDGDALVFAEVKNYGHAYSLKDIQNSDLTNSRYDLQRQVRNLFELKSKYPHKNVIIELVFPNGITNRAHEVLRERFGPDLRIYSGIQF